MGEIERLGMVKRVNDIRRWNRLSAMDRRSPSIMHLSELERPDHLSTSSLEYQ